MAEATQASIDSLIPLPPQTYHVLLTIGEEVLHGYAIIEGFEALTEGRETLLPGSLYATLARMVDEGLLAETRPPSGASSRGARRRYYSVTPRGRQAARAESARRQMLLERARAHRLAPDA